MTTAVTTGTLLVFTDLALTSGCAGRPESAEVLLRSAEAWLRSSRLDFGCLAMQLGFDVAGRPQLVLAVGGSDVPGDDGTASRGTVGSNVAVDVRECTICTFTENLTEDQDPGDAEVALLAQARSWMHRHKDFAITGSWLAHDSAGHANFVLIGDGSTAVLPSRSGRPRLTSMPRG